MALDPSRLHAQLLNTGLQNKDNALFQVLHDLIGNLGAVNKQVSSSSAGSAGSVGPIGPAGPQGIQGLQGFPGLDGEVITDDVIVFQPRSIQDLISSFTQGSVIFVGPSGILSQDNAKLFWDDTNFKLGIGTATPNNILEVVGGGIRVQGSISGIATGKGLELTFNGGTTGVVQAYDRAGAVFLGLEHQGSYVQFTALVGNNSIGLVPSGSGAVGIGGRTASFPGLKASGTVLQVSLADGSAASTLYTANGAVGAPAYSFNSDPTTGMYNAGAGLLRFAIGGVGSFFLQSNGYFFALNQPVVFGSSFDVGLSRTAASTLALGNSTFADATGTLKLSKIIQSGKTTTYNNIATVGWGIPAVYGIDNRTGLTGADGAAITLYTTIAANNIFRVSADIFATAAVTGTATYTITWTENATTQTMVVTATAINTLGTISNLIRPDNATTITAQLTGVFTGTFTVVGLVEQVA